MKIEDLKLFALFCLKEDEILTNKEKSILMDFIESANEKEILNLLLTGQKPEGKNLNIKEIDARTLFQYSKSGGNIDLASQTVAGMFASIAYKMNRKYFTKMKNKCEQEKGFAKKTCFNKIKRDAIRTEIVALNSLKVKCRDTSNSETCIKKVDARIKDLQKKMDTIKVF
jgi:hypothetical protein